MLSRLFGAIPRRYRYLAIATVTALSIPVVGLAVHFSFLEPAPGSVELSASLASALPKSTPLPELRPELQTEPTALIITPIPADSTPETLNLNPQAARPNTIAGTKFNHFPYDEAYGSDLELVGMFTRDAYEREEYLHREAAAAFKQMKVAAAAAAIKIQAISGFRTIARQAALFEDQVTQRGNEAAAAKISAPPGHSEHHTGYAVDIGDVTLPKTDITYEFQNTPAYRWLLANAHRYGFEQSFPENNSQGVSFEPWHWRYIGSEEAAAVFASGQFTE